MDLRIGVVGATGALGREIMGVLNKTTWRPNEMVPTASAATSTAFVEYGDEQVAVDDTSNLDLPELDAVIVAAPKDVGGPLAREALRAGVPVVDCTGFLGEHDEAPYLVPWVNPEAMQAAVEQGAIAVPGAASILLASALGPLMRAGIVGEVQATLLYPASAAGRDGIEELSKQVVALFNAGTPPRRIFEHGLAFDLIPQMGSANDDGWSTAETDTVHELHQMLGEGLPLGVTAVTIPVFSGLSADVHLRTAKRLVPDVVQQVFQDGGLRTSEQSGARYTPRPRRVEGNPFVHVGRIRTDSSGQHLHFWLGMDNLRATATVAVGCCAALLREEIEAYRADQSEAE